MPDTRLLDLLQVADSTFPSGSYAHSMGLETLLGEPAWSPFDLQRHLCSRLASSVERLELPIVREAFGSGDVQELQDLDGLLDVLTPVREFRLASRAIGRAFLRAAGRVRSSVLCQAAEASGIEHQPVVFGVVLAAWGLGLEEGLAVYAWQSVRQHLTAAQRLGRIGQTAVQDLLHALKPAVLRAVERSAGLSREELGVFTPWIDLAGMRHERQMARLFQS